MREIGLREAKARLSEVVDKATEGETTVITRHGRKEAVVLSFAEWSRLTKAVPSLAQHLANMPEGLEIERMTGSVREVEF